MGAAFPSPSLYAPTGKLVTLSLLHLHFLYGVAGDGYLPPILEAVARGRGRMEGLATFNQALMRVLTSCCRVFGGKDHFSTSLPRLTLLQNVSLPNPSLHPACNGGEGSRPG